MKFGKSFEHALEEENFPEEWISASIKYKQLKVCHFFSIFHVPLISLYRNVSRRFNFRLFCFANFVQVVLELSSLGLNASTLHLLVSGPHGYAPPSHEDKAAYIQYEFEGIALFKAPDNTP